jgi:hypothetical protein
MLYNAICLTKNLPRQKLNPPRRTLRKRRSLENHSTTGFISLRILARSDAVVHRHSGSWQIRLLQLDGVIILSPRPSTQEFPTSFLTGRTCRIPYFSDPSYLASWSCPAERAWIEKHSSWASLSASSTLATPSRRRPQVPSPSHRATAKTTP